MALSLPGPTDGTSGRDGFGQSSMSIRPALDEKEQECREITENNERLKAKLDEKDAGLAQHTAASGEQLESLKGKLARSIRFFHINAFSLLMSSVGRPLSFISFHLIALTAVREEQFQSLKHKLDEKDAQIEKLKGRLDEKDAQMEKLKGRLDEKDAQIGKLREQTDRREGAAAPQSVPPPPPPLPGRTPCSAGHLRISSCSAPAPAPPPALPASAALSYSPRSFTNLCII